MAGCRSRSLSLSTLLRGAVCILDYRTGPTRTRSDSILVAALPWRAIVAPIAFLSTGTSPRPPNWFRMSPVRWWPAHGAGPRHLAFHPNSRFVFVLNELNSTITVYGFDADEGRIHEVETVSTIPHSFQGENMAAEIEASACGRFLYSSNRGHNSIAMFRVDADKGRLEPLGHCSTRGDWPRTFRIDPTGSWLVAANQRTSDAFVFRIDPDDGGLTSSGDRIAVINPTCICFYC